VQPELAAAVREQVARALEEDLGRGDLTADLIEPARTAHAEIIARQAAVIAGCAWCGEVFRQVDRAVQLDWLVADGARVAPGQCLLRISGPARSLLSAERTALNFLQSLSGTATQAAAYVDAVAGTGVRILDTRKTIPGLRLAQKYAVTQGGASNHRIGLFDAILIKENHILAAGSIAAALQQAQRLHPQVPIEIEVENLDELEQALAAGAHRVLLDNFSLEELRRAVAVNHGRARLEASGGVELTRVRAIAETGVDDISIGAMTKHLQAVDLSLLFLPDSRAHD
jgi:nicotinate-nucleotide pyrophosphorylase (carboxylating)